MLFWHPNEMLEMQSTHRWSWMPFGECSEYAAINWLIIWRSFFDGPIFFLDHLLPWVCTTIFFIQNIFCTTLEATVCKASFVNILLSSRQCLVANGMQTSGVVICNLWIRLWSFETSSYSASTNWCNLFGNFGIGKLATLASQTLFGFIFIPFWRSESNLSKIIFRKRSHFLRIFHVPCKLFETFQAWKEIG